MAADTQWLREPRAWVTTLALLALVASSLLPGCGFRLRGAAGVPPSMARTYLEGTPIHGPLGVEITSTFARAGASIVSDPATATARLRIVNEDSGRRVLALDEQRRASEYELFYEIAFELRGVEGDVLAPVQSVRLTRSYSFDNRNVLAKGEEEELLQSQMRSMAVRQMLQRLWSAERRAQVR